MPGRVTIQDIADALGLSRNTVSKAINNTGIIADDTREKILQKAVEMGYKQFSYVSVSNGTNITAQLTSAPQDTPASVPDNYGPSSGKNIISLFTTMFLGNSHFSSTMLDKFQREMSHIGYSLTIHRVSTEDISSLSLPRSFNADITAGIVCIEIFDQAYSEMICELGIPALFVDAPANLSGAKLKADRLLMDNRTNIHAMVNELSQRGMTKFGFIGEAMHCMSFFERYMAFREALEMLGLPLHKDCCILERDRVNFPDMASYQSYLEENLRRIKELPDVFICANDFVALDALQAMRKLGISVPDDVCLCGFDDSPESRVVTPPLTTVHIHSQIMGFSAVHLMLSRIREPFLNYRTIYTETSLIFRESTRD